ncbi:ABC-type antimicrobial peptide transport system permease subunit [Mycoplasmopsis mustelae]|uniref:ABC-type antimicrobial peptide transport system permease subunit n=1 Tax=Mycoplasmopsis mustelae TaxID=171289 RepID=A0A4R7UEB6_9BACT|nr:ABC transporter permease [Mycoplasmopsis mustelae]TDV24416.1 ABC-type antimicrobial peptide transport system permease subunit [Mycoplasmopsis mustelae]
MWNLFKEVFRSLFKNKVIVIGLSLLIFLTAGIFTVLYDSTKAMRNQFNTYKKLSVNHDLTVDFNLPSSGTTFNDGYYINGYSKVDGGSSYDKGIKYVADDAFNEKNIIDFASIKDRYIDISTFFKQAPLRHKYILKNDFAAIYNTYNFSNSDNQNTNVISLDFNDDDKKIFFHKDFNLKLYQKDQNQNYIVAKNSVNLNQTSQFHFDKTYTLSDISYISSQNNDEMYISQLATLYINATTKELTFDFIKGRDWKYNNAVIEISNDKLANLLSLKQLASNTEIYELDKNRIPTLYIKNQNDDISSYINKKLKNNVLYTDLFSEPNKTVDYDEKFTFEKGKSYNIPLSWAKIQRSETFFLRKVYDTTFDSKNAQNWTGSYKTFMENQIRDHGDLPKNLKHFSYWEKEILIYNIPFIYNENTKKIQRDNKELIKQQNPSVSNNEILKTKLSLADNIYQPKLFKKDLFQLRDKQTIAQMENIKTDNQDAFKNLINKNILPERFQIIKDGALNVIKQNIYNFVKSKVGEQNVGIRQSITIDSFQEGDDGKKVYHFVNLGDNNHIVDDIQNNINKLIEEQKQPTEINRASTDISAYFKTKEINPYISSVILNSLSINILPYHEYVKPVYEFANIEFVNETNGNTNLIKNGKIYNLTRYQGNENLSPEKYNKFSGLGGSWLNGYFVILKPIYDTTNNNIIKWKNVHIDGFQNGGIPKDKLLEYLTQNSLSLMTQLNPNSWVEKSETYSNSVYLPFGYSAPNVDIINQALTEKTLTLGVERIEKALLNTDLVKLGFISKDSIYALTQAVSVAFDKNDFASVFSSGAVNLNILPKMILDGLYELSHNTNKDYFRQILTEILEKIYQLIDEAEQKQVNVADYIGGEINKLLNFINLLTGNNFSNITNLPSLLKISRDPKLFVKLLINLVNTIDFKKFTDLTENFFKTEYNKLSPNPEFPNDRNKDVQRKLSIYEIIIALLKSIDQNSFKQVINAILDNIDTNVLLNFNDKNNLFVLLFGDLFKPITAILDKINAYKNDDKLSFKNIIDGIKFIINDFDLNIFISTLESNLKVTIVPVERQELDISKNVIHIKGYQALTYLNDEDIIYSIFKSLFSVSGSNKKFKDEISKMFNLSNKGTSFEIGDNQYITIPSKDNNKLDFFDLLNTQNNTSKQSDASTNNNNNNSTTRVSQNSRIENIENFIRNFATLNEINWNNAPDNVRSTGLLLFGIKNFEQTWDKNKIDKEIAPWIKIINSLTPYNNDGIKTENSLAKLSEELTNRSPNLDSNIILSLSQSLLSKLIVQKQVGYNYLYDILPLIRIWLKIYSTQSLGTYEERNKFANDLLKLANNSGVITSFNDFNLFQPSAQNIARSNETNFGISRSLANPEKMRDLFFKKDINNKYLNPQLQSLVTNNPLFTNFLDINSYDITKSISYIASSAKYLSFDPEITTYQDIKIKYKNIFATFIDLFINNIVTPDFYNHINTLNLLLKDYELSYYKLDRLGVSEVLLNPILRKQNPQVLIWMLADTNNIGAAAENNSNLEYFLSNKIINFESLINQDKEKVYEFIRYFFPEKIGTIGLEKDFIFEIAIDNDFFVKIGEEVTQKPEFYKFFGINLGDTLLKLIHSLTNLNKINNILVFNQVSSYIAKVNYAFLSRNNKEIYNGTIPDDPILMNKLLKNLPNKYKINVNGSEYLIVGSDITFDYFYPVLDENNLQVNTNSQAVVYVNDKGFDRIRQAYQGTLVKEYLTVKNVTSSHLNNFQLRNEIEKVVQENIDDPTKLKRTYLYNEIDPINPERSIRISSIEIMITSLTFVSNVILAGLILLVTVSIIFIIKRYIANKNKVIGILVAQGYTPLQIAMSMTIFAFFTILTGDILGYITGFLLQSSAIRILDNYWTVPIQTLNFSAVSLLINIIVPLIAMSILIILISLRALRYKSIDLMSGIVEVSTGKTYRKWAKLFQKRNIKTKFGASLIFNSFWKLSSFGISIILATITTSFGFATFGVFDKAIQKTYQNRKYNYKIDLITPTDEGGVFRPLNPNDIKNNLYVPVGNISELNSFNSDYFKAGYSSAININDANGKPTNKDGHLITQFSINIKINSSIQIDPFNIVYQSLPDVQKARILQTRDKVGFALTHTQENVPFINKNGKLTNQVDYDKAHQLGIEKFFLYVPNKTSIIEGRFYQMQWSDSDQKYNFNIIKTGSQTRNEYREFLVKGYQKLAKNNNIHDFFIIFNGLYLNPQYDETYTYVDSDYKKEKIRLYGYRPNSKLIQITSESNENLLKDINDEFSNKNNDTSKDIPLIINYVSAHKFHLSIGSRISLTASNLTNRYQTKFNETIGINPPQVKSYNFIVRAINPTFINNEFIIPKAAADQIIGLDTLVSKEFSNQDNDLYKFNGILSSNPLPLQILWSANLYSVPGYSASISSLSTKSITDKDKENLFDGIFGSIKTVENTKVNGALATLGYSDEQIAKFLDPNFNPKTVIDPNDPNENEETRIKKNYDKIRQKPDDAIERFAKIFDEQIYIPAAYTLDAKSIEILFTQTIAKTVQIIVTIVTILSFLISILILIIISTILINENEKNIAIWAIQGYNRKEKIKMFFGIYIPFILISIIISIPIAFGVMVLFGSILTTGASIAVPLAVTPLNILLTSLIVFGVFIITAILSWWNINKIKAIDLLKGK